MGISETATVRHSKSAYSAACKRFAVSETERVFAPSHQGSVRRALVEAARRSCSWGRSRSSVSLASSLQDDDLRFLAALLPRDGGDCSRRGAHRARDSGERCAIREACNSRGGSWSNGRKTGAQVLRAWANELRRLHAQNDADAKLSRRGRAFCRRQLEGFGAEADRPRVVWLMVPAAAVESTIYFEKATPHLEAMVTSCSTEGNSHYHRRTSAAPRRAANECR